AMSDKGAASGFANHVSIPTEFVHDFMNGQTGDTEFLREFHFRRQAIPVVGGFQKRNQLGPDLAVESIFAVASNHFACLYIQRSFSGQVNKERYKKLNVTSALPSPDRGVPAGRASTVLDAEPMVCVPNSES